MPSRKVHLFVDRMFFGRTYPKIHAELDKGFKKYGRRHRAHNHDTLSAVSIAQKFYPYDQCAVRAALLHLHIDDQCSRDPEFRRTLEMAAIMNSGKKKRKRRRRIRAHA